MAAHFEVIYTARNELLAHVLKNLLEQCGIAAVVHHEGADHSRIGVRVSVAREHVPAAARLVEEFDQRSRQHQFATTHDDSEEREEDQDEGNQDDDAIAEDEFEEDEFDDEELDEDADSDDERREPVRSDETQRDHTRDRRSAANRHARRIAARRAATARAAARRNAARSAAQWPECPSCHKPRTCVCPICKTSGTDFPRADANFIDSLVVRLQELPLIAPSNAHGNSPGSETSISPAAGPIEKESLSLLKPGLAAPLPSLADSKSKPIESRTDQPRQVDIAIVCPMCDEPGIAQFLRHCEWCGHDFGIGLEPPEPEVFRQELSYNGRIFVVVAAMVGVAIAAMLWLAIVST